MGSRNPKGGSMIKPYDIDLIERLEQGLSLFSSRERTLTGIMNKDIKYSLIQQLVDLSLIHI